ncbi:hypothetical protein PL8927_830286 [Planktothrix serta PCC 8927]|uniref:Uncharacterized protein n=1 Tax=Planktothrix serta PCC 8927 TaxID=671068 RepID=A0A7Z9C0I5_9CYAN|nr:hypothetical protein PL8927_830286 [Planktothrix serta PCC 8927]
MLLEVELIVNPIAVCHRPKELLKIQSSIIPSAWRVSIICYTINSAILIKFLTVNSDQ